MEKIKHFLSRTISVMEWTSIGLISMVLITTAAYGSDKKIKVAFFGPSHGTHLFWRDYVNFMQGACNDLDIDLTVNHAGLGSPIIERQVREALSGQNKPDVIIFKNFKRVAPTILELAEKAKVAVMITNAGLTGENKEKYGKPREKFKYWIGQMLPEDENAGYDQANLLIEYAKKHGKTDSDGKVYMIAITGTLVDESAILRNIGLKRAIKNQKDVILQQLVSAHWQKDRAKKVFFGLSERYPETTVVWGGNDPMAMGILEGMKEKKLTPGHDMIVGGIDWTKEGIEAVQSGKMVTTLGGHFMEGGWLMVLAYDYFHGSDFGNESTEMRTSMDPITKENVNTFLTHLGDQNWDKIDFRKFSKVFNPKLKKYNFGLEAILSQFK